MSLFTYNLPLDLTLMILMEIDSPLDLSAFIRTAKFVYQIFQTHRSSIRSAVLKKAVFPGTLKDLLIVNHVYSICSISARPDYLRRWSTNNSVDLKEDGYEDQHLQRVQEHLSFSRGVNFDQHVQDPDTLQSLCKLWTLVNYFAEDFAADALAHFQHLQSSTNTPSSQLISKTERARIFRAFFRFEEYRRLCGGPDHLGRFKTMDGKELVSEKILTRFQRWELLEIRCIYRYLARKMAAVMEEEEDKLFKFFTENLQQEGDDPGEFVSLECLELHGLGAFHSKNEQKGQVRFMTELGLPLLMHISAPDSHRRLTALATFYSPFHSSIEGLEGMLPRFISYSRRHDDSVLPRKYEEYTTEQLDEENFGFRYFMCDGGASVGSLDRAGMIFWDRSRLETVPLVPGDDSIDFASQNRRAFEKASNRGPPPHARPHPTSPTPGRIFNENLSYTFPPFLQSRPSLPERITGKVHYEILNDIDDSLDWQEDDGVEYLDNLEY